MANEHSKEQLVDAQNTRGSAQGTTETEHETLGPALETMSGSDKDISHSIQAALDRLQTLENGHRELTSMVQ